MNKTLENAEAEGRGGDRLLGHLTPGDLVIPRGMVKPEWREFLKDFFDVDTYTAGHEKNSLNPITGLPEFADGLSGGGFDSGETPETSEDVAVEGGADGPGGGGRTGIGGFVDMVGNFLGEGGPVGANAMDGMGVGGGMDSLNPGWNNPLFQAAASGPTNFGTAIPALNAPTAPNVPDSLPQIGNYYNLLKQGDNAAAQNMLSQFMRGDRDVYGR